MISFKKILSGFVISAAIFGLFFQNQAQAAAAPFSVAAVSGDGQVVLTWTNPAESIFRYIRIYRSLILGQMGDPLADKIQDTTYTDLNAVNGKTYYYNVRSVDNSANVSNNTDQVSATPAAATVVVPVPSIVNTSAEKSTVEVFPKSFLANGIQTSDIIVTIKDSDGNPLPNKTVTVYSSRGTNDTIPVSIKQTGVDGVAMFEIKSSLVGYATIVAMNGDIQLVQTPVVTIFSAPLVQNLVSGGLYRASGDTRVYVIENNTKYWIKTAEEFNAGGYDWNKVSETSSAVLALYSDATTVAARIKINTAALRVRSMGSTAGAVIGAVKYGENYTVIEEVKGWYKIKTSGGVVGWVMKSYTIKM